MHVQTPGPRRADCREGSCRGCDSRRSSSHCWLSSRCWSVRVRRPPVIPNRSTYHYTAATNLVNDAIGRLVYHAGNHHMYYQVNPYGTTAGKGSWDPATSTGPPAGP